ncbi:MAG: arylsulfotransferase family protein [bacterium]
MRSSSVFNGVLLIVLLALAGFVYGFLSAETGIPPYARAHRAYEWAQRHYVFQKVRNLLTGRRYQPLPDGSWQSLDDANWYAGQGDHGPAGNFSGVGYLSGYKRAGDLKGVSIYRSECAQPGLNLVTSGHAPEALLMDMEGRVLHRWAIDFADAFPDHDESDARWKGCVYCRDFWRRTYLYPNGDLLAIFDGYGIIKLDRDSRLIWANACGAHHDLFVDQDGLIYVLTRKPRDIPRFSETVPVLEDFVTVLDRDGKVIKSVSVIEAFERSSYAPMLRSKPLTLPDLLHTNTVQVLDGSHEDESKIFKRGLVLISSRNIDVIALVDLSGERVTWALTGQWVAQHEPTLLPDGDILLFDNQGHFGMSKVIELDPLTQEIVWAYEGTPENGFFSETSGSTHRLANGNTLIVESNSGRAFEVAVDGEIVWEYFNPERAGEKNELIATLFDIVRIDGAYVASWLPGLETGPQAGAEPCP